MKTTILLLLLILISSCATSGRVCGGKGGQRCVQNVHFYAENRNNC
jgi:hypothetical protein